MKIASYSFVLISISVLIQGCASTPQYTNSMESALRPRLDCSCSRYQEERPRPAWINKDEISASVYQSSGISQCTGLQGMDFDDADLAARSNLVKMVNSDVRSEVTVIQRDYGSGVSDEKTEIKTGQVSELLLENSSIFDRWVDPGSCTVHAGVRVVRQDLQAALAKQERTQQDKLINQTFFIKTHGQRASTVDLHLRNMASRLGVTRIQKRPSRSAFEIHGKLSGVSHTNNGMVTRVNISLDILDPSENTIWSREIKGKSITFSQLEGKAMINLAIEDAMGNAEAELKVVLQKSGSN